MAITAKPYDAFMVALFQGVHDLSEAATYRVALLDNTYVPDLAGHASAADLTGELSTSGTGYTTATLANVTVPPAANQQVTVTADTIVWASLTATFRYAVVYRDGGTPEASALVGLIDFETDQTYSAEQFQLQFPYGLISLLG